MIMKIAARVRGLFSSYVPENREEEEIQINPGGNLITAFAQPQLAELVRMGDSWQVVSAGVANITVLPTTTMAFALWNGEPANGKIYVIDSVTVSQQVIDVTQNNMLSVFVMLNTPPISAPTDAGIFIRSLAGRAYGGRARSVAGGACTNHGWFPAGNSAMTSGVLAGSTWRTTEAQLQGSYIVPPGSQFNVQCVSTAAVAASCFITIRWHEVMLSYKT